MTARETSQDIDNAAADWVARIDRGSLSGDEERVFQAWLKEDARHRGAFLRADALWLRSDSARALGPHFNARDFEEAPEPHPAPPMVTRRRAMVWAGGGAAAAASLVGLGISLPAWGAITTRRGEIRRVPLGDGSSVELNTETSLKVQYDAEERRILLLYGEAYFTVIRNDPRPFIVQVGQHRIHTSLASFSVSSLKDKPVDILVNQGRVEFTPPPALSAPVMLPANTRLTLPVETAGAMTLAPQIIPPRTIAQQLAWRDGKLAFEGERLDDAAAQFARYSETRIVVADPVLAAEPITGLFAANDPVGFSRAVASIVDARIDRDGDALILRRLARP
ncbi:FecR domain-containing protein [Sphingobium sp. EM0848]|uniref:FecR family protein n=1 Tax=Sphingobium sp. EM0848 TaxID=2743473 RepID=UPI00159C3432|nr:FecR domain-containing protein [Sphingobium sp. EM0848]